MTQTKSHIPKIRFKEFSLEWEENIFGSVAKFSKGKGISKDNIVENGNLECIRYGELYTTYGETIKNIKSKTNLDKNDLVLSEYNDIIIPASGETQIDIATASCVLKDGVALGGDLNIIKTKNNGIFLSYYLNNRKKIDIARLSQGVSVVHLYSSQLQTLKLNLPSLPEQQKIASFLSSVDEKIEKIKEKKKNLEEYKKGVMQKIFSQEIRFKDENGEEFGDWKIKKLGEILKESNNKTTINNQYDVLSSTSNELVLQSEYFNRQIASKDNIGYKIIKRNQIVFSPQNLWLGNINLNLKYDIGIVSPSYKIFDINTNVCLVKYTSYFLKSNRMLFEYAQASEQGASIVRRNLDINSFNSIKINLPTLKEQEKIADFLSGIDEKIEKVSDELEKMEEFKKGLLQGMFV